MKKKLLYGFFILGCIHCCAQSFPSIKFSHLTEKEGLTNNIVHCIAQDVQGFMWFGTDNGLNRFDGYRIKKFYHQPADTNSLVNNQVMNIESDKKNNLWISTGEGLSFFNRGENNFINFKHKNTDTSSIKTDNNSSLFTDKQNNEWVTVSAGFYSFNQQLHYTYIPIDARKRFAKKTQVQIIGLYTDAQQQSWAYAENSLFRLNKDKVAIDTFSSPSGFIVAFYQDSKGNYWAGTFQGGLYSFNSVTGRFTQVSAITNHVSIFSITEWKDKNNFSWLALGSDNGLILFDPVTQKSCQYMHDALNDFSVSGNEVYKVFTDKENILWLATNKGVSYIEPSKQLIETWRIPLEQKNSYTENAGYMYSFFEDENGYLMSNWSHAGLYHFDAKGSLIKTILSLYPQNRDSSMYYNTCQAFSIVKDKEKNYWFSVNAGLIQFNSRQQSFKLFQPPDGSVSSGFRNISVLNDTAWFIRTRNNGSNGIYVFNPEKKKYVAHYFVVCCKNCPPANLMAMIVTKKGEIFAAPRNNRLYQYDARTNSFIVAPINNPNANINSTFYCLAEDKEGNVWIGMANGLIEYDPVSKSIVHDFTTDAVLGGVAIQQICVDDDENLWMNTESGLYCLLQNQKSVFNFNAGDGLPNNSLLGFLVNAKDGNIYCGAEGYVVKFNPKKLLSARFTNIKTFFSEANAENKTIPFTISGDEKKIVVTPRQNIFSVDFAVLNFDNAESNRYYYKLDGAMNEWKENENGHLTFYNLPPGNYTLHVQGGNKYGERFLNEDVLLIAVQPRWWQTAWFILLAIVFFAALAVILIRRRFQQVRNAAELKQKIAETEMIALRAQMNPHFIFNCLNSIDNLIQTNEKEKATSYLARFAKLIRAILENSKSNSIACWKDLETLKLYLELEELRWDKKIAYTLNIAPQILQGDYKVPPMIIQPYVENAIHHGLLNKEQGIGKLLIKVSVEKNYIIYTIEDNGIGRKKAMEYKLLNKPTHQSMGLDITRERVNLFNQNNNGSVTITDLFNEYKEAVGTRVILSLLN